MKMENAELKNAELKAKQAAEDAEDAAGKIAAEALGKIYLSANQIENGNRRLLAALGM